MAEADDSEEEQTAWRVAAFMGRVDFTRGPVPAVVCDVRTREVRMVAWMSREALERTLRTGQAHFHSRSRDRAWKKGETSGAVQWVRKIWLSCDQDALVLEVEQVGEVTCHRGTRTCFTNGLTLTAEAEAPVHLSSMGADASIPAAPLETFIPVAVGVPASQRSGILQQPLDSLVLETHVRPLLTAYQALLRLDHPPASPFGDLRGVGRETLLPHLRDAVARVRAAARAEAPRAETLAAAADVWSWSALNLLREDAADAASMAAAIAQGYFGPRLAADQVAERLEDAARQLTLEAPRAQLAAAILSLLEGCGACMRGGDLRPYAFLDHDRRQLLERRA